ncbi:MAG: chemotaxis protein CheW [Anaerolineales bacterium]
MSDSQLTTYENNQPLYCLTFRVGAQWYGLDVAHVFEVYTLVAISEVPDMPPAILGVVNIRGVVVPVLDLRIRFGATDTALALTTPLIFLHENLRCTYGVIVDDIDDIITTRADAITTTMLSQRASHIIGMLEHKHRLLMLLQPQELLVTSLEDRDLSDMMSQIRENS